MLLPVRFASSKLSSVGAPTSNADDSAATAAMRARSWPAAWSDVAPASSSCGSGDAVMAVRYRGPRRRATPAVSASTMAHASVSLLPIDSGGIPPAIPGALYARSQRRSRHPRAVVPHAAEAAAPASARQSYGCSRSRGNSLISRIQKNRSPCRPSLAHATSSPSKINRMRCSSWERPWRRPCSALTIAWRASSAAASFCSPDSGRSRSWSARLRNSSLRAERSSPRIRVMAQVGHADSKMTMDVYAQLEQRADRSHGTRFDALLRGAKHRLEDVDWATIGPRDRNRPMDRLPQTKKKRRRKRRFARTSPMARPGLEPGTPRFSEGGRPPNRRSTCKGHTIGRLSGSRH